MKVPSAQELFDAGKPRREEPGVELDPLQALRLRLASGRAQEDGHHCRLGSDSIGQALSVIEHGGARSFTDAYRGQLSNAVLSRLVEAGHYRPVPEAA